MVCAVNRINNAQIWSILLDFTQIVVVKKYRCYNLYTNAPFIFIRYYEIKIKNMFCVEKLTITHSL